MLRTIILEESTEQRWTLVGAALLIACSAKAAPNFSALRRSNGARGKLGKSPSQRGYFTMYSNYKVANQIELEGGTFSEDLVREGLRIEEILYRAHQIHRARGGLIGYDLEDWLQAGTGKNRRNQQACFQIEIPERGSLLV